MIKSKRVPLHEKNAISEYTIVLEIYVVCDILKPSYKIKCWLEINLNTGLNIPFQRLLSIFCKTICSTWWIKVRIWQLKCFVFFCFFLSVLITLVNVIFLFFQFVMSSSVTHIITDLWLVCTLILKQIYVCFKVPEWPDFDLKRVKNVKNRRGALPPCTPHRGAAPGPRRGLRPLDPGKFYS